MSNFESQKRSTDIPKEKESYNGALSEKARASVAVSTLLILSSMGLIQLNQLPFIGASLKSLEGGQLTYLLIAAALYFLYRYTTYRRVVELESKADTLTHLYGGRILLKLGKKRLEEQKPDLLKKPFQFEGTMLERVEAKYTKNIRGLRIDDGVNGEVTERDLYGFMARDEFKGKPVEISLKVAIDTGEYGPKAYCLMPLNLSSTQVCLIKKTSTLLAWFRLPDFLEKTFPKVLFVIALGVAMYTSLATPPEAKPKTSCEAAASTMIKVCT